MNALTAVSLFAGIGGIDRALELAGVAVTAAVEIDSDCRGVLRRHFPGTAIFNDVTEVTGDQLRAAGFVPGRGILAGGFPCQDLSVAGRRAGLGGARSGLFWHIMRLADELRPRWLLLENVPGLLSAVCPCPGDGACVAGRRAVACGEWRGDRDTREWLPDVPHGISGGACPGGCMAAHGGAMGTVLGALGERGYGFAYRVLDAQFFGVPQRRRRVFIAGCLGDRAAPVQVLLEPESGAGHLAAGGQAGPGAAIAPGGGAVSALQGGGRRGHRVDAEGAAGGQLITGTLTAGMLGDYDDNTARQGFMVAHSTGAGWWTEGVGTLRAQGGGTDLGGHLVAHAITSREGKGPDSDATSGFITAPLLEVGARTGRSTDDPQAGIGIGADGDPMFTLQAGKQHGIAVSVSNDAHPVVGRDQVGALKIGTGPGIPSAPAVAMPGAAVRRLTPMECERLQGFPDGWTRLRGDGTEQSDSTRYRQLGNAVAVPVVAWITRRIAAVERSAAVDAEGAA